MAISRLAGWFTIQQKMTRMKTAIKISALITILIISASILVLRVVVSTRINVPEEVKYYRPQYVKHRIISRKLDLVTRPLHAKIMNRKSEEKNHEPQYYDRIKSQKSDLVNADYRPLHTNNKTESCCLIARKHNIKKLCPTTSSAGNQGPTMGNSSCTCTDYMLCKLVFVTALSGNHYRESQDFFGSIHYHLPNARIVVYDLGLKSGQLKRIESYCNTEVKKFKFKDYPLHTKYLKNFAWKPLIIKETSQKYELFLYCDTSCRINKVVPGFILDVLKYPILPCSQLAKDRSVMRSTHAGMFKYLHVNQTRLELIKHPTFEAGAVLYWANDFLKKQFLPQWVDCALHIECISPIGAVIRKCDFSRPEDVYVGCHRYDQSAFNAILLRDFGGYSEQIAQENGAEMIRISRSVTNKYPNKCTRSNIR